MASTIAASSTVAPHLLHNNNKNDYEIQDQAGSQTRLKDGHVVPHDVVAEFNYYKDPCDGSLPTPSVVGRPETYEKLEVTKTHVVHDIRGEEDQYSLDKTGFQIYKHVSRETAFEDDEEIKRMYYPEIEEILKSA